MNEQQRRAMTYVELYAVRDNGDTTKYDEVRNAWGGAMYIWITLKDKYKTGGSFLEGFSILWKSIGKMSESDQWVLASTFDGVIVPEDQLPTLITHLETFVSEHGGNTTLAGEIDTLKRASTDSEIQGICFNQTSVSDPHWSIATSDDDGSRPYNINTGTDHWFLTPESVLQVNREQKNAQL